MLKVFLPCFTEWLCSCEAPWTPCNPFLPSVSTAVYTHTPHTHTRTHTRSQEACKVFQRIYCKPAILLSKRERDRVPGSLYLNVCVCLSLCCVLPARRPRQTSSSTQFLLSFQDTKQSTSEEQCACACTVNVGLCVDVHTCVHEFVSVFD